MTHEVEFLWLQGCPNHEAARAILDEVIDDVAPGTTVRDIDATDPEIAKTHRLPRSPTIRVHGTDVDPAFLDSGDYTPRCRLFRSDSGIVRVPERRWIEDISRAGRAIAVVLLVLVAIAGCDDSGPLRDLRAMPEATLYYPDSKVVREIATPQINSPDGKSGAAFGHLLGANATPDEVLAFYDRELQARGWRTTAPDTGTSELKVAAWTNDKAIFRLGINLPESLTQDVRAALAVYSIEYDARVIQIYPPPT